jgi:hypothetical protein
VRRARDAVDQRERERLADKLGADDPRVAGLDARLDANQVLMGELDAEGERAGTAQPGVGDDEWKVHGRVRDATGAGLVGVGVALHDAHQQPLADVSEATTGATGYFRLQLAHAEQEPGPVHLVVLGDDGRPRYRDPRAMTPAAGTVLYRELRLPAAGAPPADVPGVPTGGGKRQGRSDLWTVRGRVTDAGGQPLGGVTVSLYDADLIFDDRLGQTRTDADGSYELIYRTSDFRDLIERRPDLYIKVLDERGKTLHTTPAGVRPEASRTEIIDVKVKG